MVDVEGGRARRRRSASILVVAGVVVVGLLVALVVALGTKGSGSSARSHASTASEQAPIVILWIGDTTGPVKVYGDDQLAGVKGAADYFNSLGGIDGHHVVVRAVSDNGDPTIAASVLTQQLASGTPTMVWAGSTSSDSGALIPILARHHVFSIALVDGQSQCQTNAAVTCPNEWTLSVPSTVAPQTAADWMTDRHFTTVGLLAETTPFSAAETPQFLAAAARDGLTVKSASYPATAVDLTPELDALRHRGAQVIYSEGIGTAGYVFTARADLAWNVPLVFDPSASALDLTKLTVAANIRNAYEDTLYQEDPQLPNLALPTMVKWASRYGNVTAQPTNVTSTGWDAVVTLNAAVHRAGGSLSVNSLDRAMLQLPPTDPLRTLTHKLGWTNKDHENVLGGPDDYVVVPVGPLVDGRVKAP